MLIFNSITEIRFLEFLFLCYSALTSSVSGFGMQSITFFTTQRSANIPSLLNIHPVSHDAPSHCNYSHRDIIWQLGPPKEATPWTKALWKFEAYQVSSFPNFKNEPILIPQKLAMLQALLRNSPSTTALARFGITTESGPPCREMDETIQDLEKRTELDVNEGQNDGVAVIKYMFVEPEHRRRMLGKLALEVISQIHAWQNCRYTVLIADDDGSGKLIQWYESNGFTRAPKLDRVFGCIPENFQDDNSSTTAQLGFAMIAPTRSALLDNYNSSNTNDIYIHCS